jgi:hypothetical protein
MARFGMKSHADALTQSPPANCSAFWPRGETRSWLEITYIQQFSVHSPGKIGLHPQHLQG